MHIQRRQIDDRTPLTAKNLANSGNNGITASMSEDDQIQRSKSNIYIHCNRTAFKVPHKQEWVSKPSHGKMRRKT